MNINEKIGQKIKETREAAGLFQKDVYMSLDIKKSTYSDIETGNVSITVENLYKVANFFKISPTVLLDIKESNIQNINDNKYLFVSQNHNGNLAIHLSKELLDNLKSEE